MTTIKLCMACQSYRTVYESVIACVRACVHSCAPHVRACILLKNMITFTENTNLKLQFGIGLIKLWPQLSSVWLAKVIELCMKVRLHACVSACICALRTCVRCISINNMITFSENRNLKLQFGIGLIKLWPQLNSVWLVKELQLCMKFIAITAHISTQIYLPFLTNLIPLLPSPLLQTIQVMTTMLAVISLYNYYSHDKSPQLLVCGLE